MPAEYPDRLLVLDDDADVGEAIVAVAASFGLDSRATVDPETFFALLADWSPAFLLIDLLMPRIDGIEVVLRLADRKCDATIILISGAGDRILAAAERAATEHGLRVRGTIAKPFTAGRLRDLLAPGQGPATEASGARLDTGDADRLSEADLDAALDGGKVLVFYQPKILCREGTISGFEALVRLEHPRHGIVLPDRFIPLAEATGRVARLTDHVVEIALDWLAATFPESGVKLSLNFSRQILGDMNLADRLLSACEARGLPPERIVLEITESSAMSDPVTTLDLVTRFRLKGFLLSIDDFGIGASSLVQLARLPFSEMKIDRSFVFALARSDEARKIVLSIIALGHSMGLRVVAEGVEDQLTLDFLRDAGCDEAQGYFVGLPMPDAALRDWLDTRH